MRNPVKSVVCALLGLAVFTAVAADGEKAEIVNKVNLKDGVKMVALTFDDGPGPNCNELMDLFKKEGVKATFFVNGKRFKGKEAVLQRMAAEGHEIGNHGNMHANMKQLDAKGIDDEIDIAQKGIEEITGKKAAFFRPPYFSYNDMVLEALGKRGIKVGGTNCSTKDWDYKTMTGEKVLAKIVKMCGPGSIITMHSWSERSFSVMPQIIDHFKKQGIQLVTVSELYANAKPKK